MNPADMERHIVETGDGSHSLYVPALDEQYHSRHGAVQESRHVFLKMGLDAVAVEGRAVRLLEIGFGTGLNALLTWQAAIANGKSVHYTGIEAFPVTKEEAAALNYPAQTRESDAERMFSELHACDWERAVKMDDSLTLFKKESRIEDFEVDLPQDLIYFDAFAPNKQPELWTDSIFEKMYRLCAPDGVLVTYCAKGD
ncbi:MAG: tRNA (5-methylaminomethyl-2-thiouridine)(34)-methyltransferase MnmD, partial [Bacteroidota bacterium]